MEVLEKELVSFLSPAAKEEVKMMALTNILGLTGDTEGRAFLGDSVKLLQKLVSLTKDQNMDVKEVVYKALINLAVDEEISWKILNINNCDDVCSDWLKQVLDPKCKYADIVCKLLSNLTRPEKCAAYVAKHVLEIKEISIERIVNVLCEVNYNENADLHYLGALLSNLSQIREVRQKLMDKELCVLQKLVCFTEFKQSAIRRGGIIGCLKNCCFDTEYHEWLLSDHVDLLPQLLLPLAGPEEFDDDDTSRLPDDLQYLPADKKREPDANIRKMLTEAILQLCATRKGRQFVKDKNTYVIMREYYAWERIEEPLNEMAVMNVIDILIGDEPAEHFSENLKEVEIPKDIVEKFEEDDSKELEMAKKGLIENKIETTI